jgi:hypothetical protein
LLRVSPVRQWCGAGGGSGGAVAVAKERKEVVTFKSHSKEAAAEEQGRRKV